MENRHPVTVGICLSLLNRWYIILPAAHGLLVYVRYNGGTWIERRQTQYVSSSSSQKDANSYILAPVLSVWCPVGGTILVEGRNVKWWGLTGGSKSLGIYYWKGHLSPKHVLSCSLLSSSTSPSSSLPISSHKKSIFLLHTLFFSMMLCPTESSETIWQIIPDLNCLSQVFCQNNTKVTNTSYDKGEGGVLTAQQYYT